MQLTDSRTISPEENSPNPQTNANPNPNLNQRTIFLVGQLSGYPINHINFVSKKKPSIDRILANLCKSDKAKWEIEGLMTCLFDIFTNNLLELTDGNLKVKETDYIEKNPSQFSDR